MPEIELLAEKFKFLVQTPSRGQILEEISKFLLIPTPNYVECLDISNLYKQDTVAGFLVFLNGEKNLAKSKLYKLKGEELESDLSRIKTACLMHYQKCSQSEMPDLIVVDGAKEQVKAVKQTLKELKLETWVIGLAKDEKHRTAKIITSNLKELGFGNKEKVKNFFTNCQEEVHRYAINFHRKVHRKSSLN
nr:12339_t:CDS:2 [Entrophospora candida]